MDRRIIITIGSFLGSILLGVFVIWPLVSSIIELKKDIQKQEKEIAAVQELINKTNQLSQEYQSMSDEINMFFMALPAKQDVSYLLVQFESLVARNGLLLEAIDFGQKAEESLGMAETKASPDSASSQKRSFVSSSVGASITGTYSAFKGFLADLEKNIRVMDVETIVFGQEKQSGESEDLELSTFKYDLKIKIYHSN